MFALRAILLQHRLAALLLVMAALAMKIVVPAGFMPGSASGAFSVKLCTGTLDQAVTASIAIPFKDGSADPAGQQAKADCPFTALSMVSLTGAEPGLLALALAFILALGFAPVAVPRCARRWHLRPPLRGPPVLG